MRQDMLALALVLLLGWASLDTGFKIPHSLHSGLHLKKQKQNQRGGLELGNVAHWLTGLTGRTPSAASHHAHPKHLIPHVEDSFPFTHLAGDISKFMQRFLHTSTNPTVMGTMKAWSLLPTVVKSLLMGMAFGDVFLFIFFQLTYRRTLRWCHRLQIVMWKWLALGTPLEFKKSILGFAEERGNLLAKIMGCNYIFKLLVRILQKIGFRLDSGLPILVSKIAYTLYGANFIDLFKTQFLPTFFPDLENNRRAAYVFDRFTSVTIWVVGVLVVCEMVSTYFKVPLSSTLAFGGVGGIALGLSARDIAANFLGGILLLFNEPFTPGDMVTFRSGNTECVGRVERVGWGQTRIRGRDTRPTYVPNSHFVSTAVTNMERISHRKYEATIPLRFQDHTVMPEILYKIKEALRVLPKLDVLAMPYRVSFVRFGAYALEIEITCYFSTKSIDEFLALQQMANLEVVRVIRECGAQLALPTTQIHMPASMEAMAFAQGTAPSLMPTVAPLPPPANPGAVVSAVAVTATGGPASSLPLPAPPDIRKKDLPPFSTVSSAQAIVASTPAVSAAAVSAAAAVAAVSASVAGGAPAGKPMAGDPSVANLSPAAAAILSKSQAGSYIAETLAKNSAAASAAKSADASATTAERRVVVGQIKSGGTPNSPEQPQQPPQPPQPPPYYSQQQPLSKQTAQQQLQQLQSFQAQAQAQQALIRAQQAANNVPSNPGRRPQRPVFAKDGSISWSWMEIEAEFSRGEDGDPINPAGNVNTF